MAAVFKTILHGFLIGVANIIPGVSGGSIALIMGIYDELIDAIYQFKIKLVAEIIFSSWKVLAK